MRFRTEVVVFGVAALLGWTFAQSSGLLEPARAGAAGNAPSGAPARNGRGDRALLQAYDALFAGDPSAADAALRQAWDDPVTRTEAARELRNLHGKPGFKLPTDEKAIADTLEKLGPGFSRSETEHFVILSNTEREWTRSRGVLLERAHHQFFRVMDRLEHPAHPPASKLLCVLFKDHAGYAEFGRRADGVEAPWVAGYYASLSNRIVFYDDRTSPAFQQAFGKLDEYRAEAAALRKESMTAKRERLPEKAEALSAQAEDLDRRVELERTRLRREATLTSESKTIHEAIHLLSFNCGLQSRSRQYPFWLTEGLATAFETDAANAAFGPDHSTAARQEEFEANSGKGRLFEMAVLVSLSAPPDRAAETADVLYSQSYALLTYLYRYERKALSAYFSDFWAEPAGFVKPQRQYDLFRARFGDPAALERRMLRRLAAR